MYICKYIKDCFYKFYMLKFDIENIENDIYFEDIIEIFNDV